MLVETKKMRNKLRELTEELPSWESAWLAIQKMENYLTELEEQEPVCEELDKAADDYARDTIPMTDEEYIDGGKRSAFIAGANWMREQMMKEAVEGEVCIPNVWVEHKEGKELVVRAEIGKELGFKFGDKVRIVVVKED